MLRATGLGRWRGRSFPQRQGRATPGAAGAGGWAGTGANSSAPARWRRDRAPAGNRAAETGSPGPAGLRAGAGCSPARPGSADQSESGGAAGRCLLRFLAKHGEAALAGVGREPQAPAQLLQKHEAAWSGALGGPQEQHGVDRGDVEPFVEQVHGEEDLQLAGLQAAQGGLAQIGGGGGIEGFGAEAAGTEGLGHEAGVLDAHAEAEGPHAGGIGHGVVALAEDQVQPAMVAGVHGAVLGGHVAAAAPLQG